MLQQDRPEDYVIATGISHSVRELVEIAFARVGLDWEKYVRRDPALLRPAEVEHLLGDATKARDRARLDAQRRFQAARRDDGRRRSRAPGGAADRHEARGTIVLRQSRAASAAGLSTFMKGSSSPTRPSSFEQSSVKFENP